MVKKNDLKKTKSYCTVITVNWPKCAELLHKSNIILEAHSCCHTEYHLECDAVVGTSSRTPAIPQGLSLKMNGKRCAPARMGENPAKPLVF